LLTLEFKKWNILHKKHSVLTIPTFASSVKNQSTQEGQTQNCERLSDTDGSSLLQTSDSMTAVVESAVPEVLAHFTHPEDDSENETSETLLSQDASKCATIRQRLSDHSRDSLSSDMGAGVSAVYTGKQLYMLVAFLSAK